MKLFTPALALLALLIFSTSLRAAETGYIIELIIYEDTKGRYINSEDWSFNDQLQHTDNQPTGQPSDTDPEFQLLDWEKAKLNSSLKKITTHAPYRVLLNQRWKQTGLDRKHAINIAIDTRAEIPQDDSLSETGENTPPTLTPEVAESYITGNVRLIMSRYLHFNVRLEYYRPTTDETGAVSYRHFPIVSERRMKSKEVHYIDHPLVGIIVLATPYKIKSADDTTVQPANYKTL